MKYAKSLAYGGELIDALECEHADFKRLVPLCPNCSNPVHLRIGGDRLSAKGTPYKIGPHFAHFAGKSAEEVAACELRVNGYSQEDRERIQRVARGQRERWVRRWLWRAFQGFWREEFPKANKSFPGSNFVLDCLVNGFQVAKPAIKNHYLDLDESPWIVEGDRYRPAKFRTSHNELRSLPRVKQMIGAEVACWIVTPGARPVATELLRVVLKNGYSHADAIKKGKILTADAPWLLNQICSEANRLGGVLTKLDAYSFLGVIDLAWELILITPWATEFARLEAEEAARAGKKCA